MSFTFVTPQVTLARNAGALYNYGLGNELMASLASSSDINGLLNSVYMSSVGNAVTSQVAKTLVANLGITGAGVAGAEAYVVAQLNSVAAAGRGKVINDILMSFSSLTGDATYGAAATAWNAKVANAVAYAAMAGSKDTTFAAAVPPTVEAPSFMLTAGAAEVNEGGTSFFTLSTKGVAAGTQYSYAIKGVSGSDVTGGVLAGTATVGADGKAIIAVSLANDTLTEGDETMTLEIAGQSAAVTVKDTSVAPPAVYTLTAGADSGSMNGTSGDDSYVAAYIGDAGTGTTFNAGDSLNGQGGVDTLSISISSAITTGTAETISAFTLTNLEKVLVSNFDTQETAPGDDHIFNMSGSTGVTTVGLSSSSATGDTTFNNLRNVVSSQMAGEGDLSVQYQSTLLTGATDSIDLAVNGVGTTLAAADFETYATLTTGVAETLNIDSTGSASNLTINANNDHKTIKVTGSANLTLSGTQDTTVTTVDASTFTGNLSLTTGVSNIAITGGTGNDTIAVAGTLTTADTIDGGAGTDTLSLTDPATLVTNLRVTNVETLRLAAASATAYDVSMIAGITTVDFRSATNADMTTTNAAEGTAVIISADNANNATHGVKDATNSNTTNAVTVTVDHSTAETDVDLGTLTLNGIETVTLVSQGVTSTDTTANVFASDVATSNSIATLAAASATAIKISGSTDFVLAATGSTVTANTSVDASALTGRLVYTNRSTATGATTITGGTKDDFITGRNGTDNISGGTGNDSLVGGGGNDTINGDAGNDTITATGTANDVITGGDGNDTITGAQGNDNLSGGAGDDSFVIGDATWTDGLTAADTLAGGDGTDSLRITTDTTLNFTSAAGRAALTNATSIERIDLAAAGAQTATIDDLTLTMAGGNLTVRATTDQAHIVNGSGVLGSTNTVNFSTSVTTATNGFSYTVGNAKDVVAMGARAVNDVVIVTTAAFLSANDTINGGGGTGDVLRFTDTNGLTLSSVTAGNALTNVTGFESINVTTGGTGNYSFTLNDAFVSANNDSSTGRITVQTTDGTGRLTVDASALSASFGLVSAQASSGAATLTGGAGNDSLTGGAAADQLNGNAGNDTISGAAGSDVINGGDGADSIIGGDGAELITGGAGNDDFVFGSATQVGNDITDFSAGTTLAAGVVDQLVFDVTGSGETGAFASAAVATALITIAAGDPTNTAAGATVAIQTITSGTADNTVLTAGTNVLVFDATTGISTAALLQAALQTAGALTLGTGTATGAGTIDGYLIALYDKGPDIGVAIIDLAAAGGAGAVTTDGSTVTEIATLTGVSSLANFDASDFLFV